MTSLKSLLEVSILCHREEALASTIESDSTAIVVVILHSCSNHRISELNHLSLDVPSVLTDPSTAAASVRVETHIICAIAI